jgi:uroporphyrinogen-III synthase
MNIRANPFVLITRPESEALDFARDVAACGFEPLICPVLEIEAAPYDAVDCHEYDGVIFTSTNGLKFFTAPPRMAAYCVGAQTAALATAQGYTVAAAAATAETLAQELSKCKPMKLLYVRGRDVAVDLAAALHDFSLTPLIVYSANPAPSFAFALRTVLEKNKIHAVSFFSKRSAKIFMETIAKEKLEAALADIRALCISQSVLEYVRPECWREVYVSETPDRAGMQAMLKRINQI